MYVLVSSHLLRDVEETCEEVLILQAGRIAAHCDPEAECRSNRRFVELETASTSPSFTGAVQAWAANAVFMVRMGGRLRGIDAFRPLR